MFQLLIPKYNIQVTFNPEVILQYIGEDLCALVSDEWITVERNASEAVHSVEIWPTISQAVFPRLVMSQHCLVLPLSNITRTLSHTRNTHHDRTIHYTEFLVLTGCNF